MKRDNLIEAGLPDILVGLHDLLSGVLADPEYQQLDDAGRAWHLTQRVGNYYHAQAGAGPGEATVNDILIRYRRDQQILEAFNGHNHAALAERFHKK